MTGVKITTIRYYESIGLLAPPERSQGNQRRYFKGDLERLSFIRHGRDLGLSLEAVRDLIDLSDEPDRSCDEAHAIAHNHLGAIRGKIKRLKKLEKELMRISTCCDRDSIGECHVIEALSDHAHCESEHG